MSEVCVNSATVELTTDGTWQWSSATPGPKMSVQVQVSDQAVAKLKANSKAVVLESHVKALTAMLTAVPYIAGTFTTPGVLKVDSISATQATLSVRLKRDSAAVLSTTSGTFTAKVTTPAQVAPPATTPEPPAAAAKAGTWKVTDSGQGGAKLKAV